MVIILTVFATILVATTTIFLGQVLNLHIVKADQAKAIYAAQAGIYRAIVDYRNNGWWSTKTDTKITNNIYYSIGGEDSNFLRVDASHPILYKSNQRLIVALYNVNAMHKITIDTLTIGWDPDSGETLTKINFAGGGDEWTGSASSGKSIPLSYTLTAGNSYSFELKWTAGNDMSGKTITAQFGFTDGSSRNAAFLVSGLAGDDDFSIKSTGKVTGKDTCKKTVVATYDVGTGKVTSWQETFGHL